MRIHVVTTLVVAWLIFAATTRAQQVRVAVLDFTPESTNVAAGDWTMGLADFVEVALQKEGVATLERRQIRLILGERDLQTRGLLAAETLRTAKLPAVSHFVSGQVRREAGDEFVLTLSLVHSENATVEGAWTRRGVYPTDWLPAIEALAKTVSARPQLPKPAQAERSEFEMITWLPEAALPFFKGLDYYGRGDYATAVPWFRSSYAKDRNFNIAHLWEARAYRRLNLPILADALSADTTNNTRVATESKRPVVAVVASEKISAAERAAFVQALAQAGRFELFEPASIGATAREIDLQLTGQMAAPLNERSVWLVVDDLIYLEAPDPDTLTVRRQNLLSGEVLQQANIHALKADENGCAALAKAFLKNKTTTAEISAGQKNTLQLPEPARQEQPVAAFAMTLRLVAANQQSARLWIGLADYYPGETRKMLLERAISEIETNRQSPDAAFWLASALWREREMTRRIFRIPTAAHLAPNPLTNDFARLLQWFPESYEAKNLGEVTNHGSGSYVYVMPNDRRYLGAVFTNNLVHPKPSGPPVAPMPASATTDAQRLSKLNDYLKQDRPAPAWQLANSLLASANPGIRSQVRTIHDRLLQSVVGERNEFKKFNAAIATKNSQSVLDLGRVLLNCVDRRQRAAVIGECGEVIRKQKGDAAQLNFLFEEARHYRNDFLLNPVTGVPADDIEYQVLENSNLIQPVINGRDYGYEPLMGKVAEIAHELPSSDLTRGILEYLRDDTSLPVEKRLTATYDLAMQEKAGGRTFEALELLKELLRQTEGTGLPLNRNNGWTQTIEGAAFDALRKIRIFAGAETDVSDCCGNLPDTPPQKPSNFEQINLRLENLWKQRIGEAGTNLPPIKEQLAADRENFFPVILYKLRTGQEVSHTLTFCGDLGTNALPALPIIAQIIHRGEPFEDYNNALYALGAMGRSAGCAKPLLILAQENADNVNFKYALKRIGPAPRRVMPALAQLLWHKNVAICEQAARAMIETAKLNGDAFNGQTGEPLILALRQWWEEDGIKQDWKD